MNISIKMISKVVLMALVFIICGCTSMRMIYGVGSVRVPHYNVPFNGGNMQAK